MLTDLKDSLIESLNKFEALPKIVQESLNNIKNFNLLEDKLNKSKIEGVQKSVEEVRDGLFNALLAAVFSSNLIAEDIKEIASNISKDKANEGTEEFLNLPIDEIILKDNIKVNTRVRVMNTLKHMDIKTGKELVSYRRKNFLKMRNFGGGSFQLIQDSVAPHGYNLK